MRHNNVVEKVSDKTGVNLKDCERVLNALEDVLEEELESSKHVGSAVDKIYNLLGYLRGKKRDKSE